jgi:hypothetical protein
MNLNREIFVLRHVCKNIRPTLPIEERPCQPRDQFLNFLILLLVPLNSIENAEGILKRKKADRTVEAWTKPVRPLESPINKHIVNDYISLSATGIISTGNILATDGASFWRILKR